MNEPLIGMGLRLPAEKGHNLSTNYPAAIYRAGGKPIAVPVCCRDFIEDYAQMLDGLVLTGGGDVDSALFGEEIHPNVKEFDRAADEGEIALFHAMRRLNKPILGICRGLQVINVALGGSLWQDIPTQLQTAVTHRNPLDLRPAPTHGVWVKEGTCLYDILGEKELHVNSYHHQAAKALGEGLKVCARAEDGVVEAFESADGMILGFQWHPEAMENCPQSDKIFKWFVEKCRK